MTKINKIFQFFLVCSELSMGCFQAHKKNSGKMFNFFSHWWRKIYFLSFKKKNTQQFADIDQQCSS